LKRVFFNENFVPRFPYTSIFQ